MEIKTLIIEDESSAQKHLAKLLNAQVDTFLIQASLSTVIDSINWLKTNPQPDLIFMDIHLSDGKSFDILEEGLIKCPIIFTTAYDQYAIKAFKTSGIGYLLKPIIKEDLEIAINKYHKVKMISSEELYLKSLELINRYKNETNYTERFLLKSGNHFIPVKTDDIAYFFRDEIVFAKCFNGAAHPMDESLNQLQKLLNPKLFVRLNRQLLVNINTIKKLTSSLPGQVTIEINPQYHEKISLSQERSSWLKQLLNFK